jgi:hypothetical protein
MSAKNWESEAGEIMLEELTQNIKAIPQDEPIFNVIWMPHDAFTTVIKKQRNIIVTKIGPDFQPKIIYHKSLWAQSQLVVEIMAPTKEAFIELYNQRKSEITEQLQDAEVKRLMAAYKKNQEKGIREKLISDYNIDLTVPKGFTINKETEGFIWLDSRYRNVIEGVYIYYYPYIDSNTFSYDYLIEK